MKIKALLKLSAVKIRHVSSLYGEEFNLENQHLTALSNQGGFLMPKFNMFIKRSVLQLLEDERCFYAQTKRADNMTLEEKQQFLKDQLDLLADTAEDAYKDGFYGDVPEIVKTALEVFDMIATT